MLQTQEHPNDVDVDHLPKSLNRVFGNRDDLAFDTGVVIEDVDGSELVDGSTHIFRYLVLAGNISGDRHSLCRVRQVLDRGFQLLLPAVHGNDARTACG